jgi:hypothetical protein
MRSPGLGWIRRVDQREVPGSRGECGRGRRRVLRLGVTDLPEDPISDGETRRSLAELDHLPGGIEAEDGRELLGKPLLDRAAEDLEVEGVHARCGDPQLHLTGFGPRLLDGVQFQCIDVAIAGQHGSSHRVLHVRGADLT